jgi:hypothetical protein
VYDLEQNAGVMRNKFLISQLYIADHERLCLFIAYRLYQNLDYRLFTATTPVQIVYKI